MSDSPTSRGISRGALVLAAATVVNLPFGTVYAFSVFLKPMEALLGIGRAEMAIVFSMASIFLTIGMLIGPALYRRFAPVPMLLVCGAMSASGLLVAAAAQGIEHLLLGYGVLFGLGGGVVFIMMQQGLNQTISPMSGLANGYVVSLYPMGAMLGAPVFGWAIEVFGLRATLAGLALTVLTCCAIAAMLWRRAQVRMQDPGASTADSEARHWGLFARLFTVFFLAASAGLMVMSQAAGILQAYGSTTLFALGGTSFITGAIAAARIGGGWLIDRFAVPRVACMAHLIAPQWFEPAIDLARSGHGGPVHDTDRLRLWLHFGSDGGCHCALLASQCLWPGGWAVVHCLVHRGHQSARAGRLAVRPDPRL